MLGQKINSKGKKKWCTARLLFCKKVRKSQEKIRKWLPEHITVTAKLNPLLFSSRFLHMQSHWLMSSIWCSPCWDGNLLKPHVLWILQTYVCVCFCKELSLEILYKNNVLYYMLTVNLLIFTPNLWPTDYKSLLEDSERNSVYLP